MTSYFRYDISNLYLTRSFLKKGICSVSSIVVSFSLVFCMSFFVTISSNAFDRAIYGYATVTFQSPYTALSHQIFMYEEKCNKGLAKLF